MREITLIVLTAALSLAGGRAVASWLTRRRRVAALAAAGGAPIDVVNLGRPSRRRPQAVRREVTHG